MLWEEKIRTEQELLEKYNFKNLDEVKLIINMSFPTAFRRLWVPVYPSAIWVIRAISFLRTYLVTDSIDVMVEWARKGNKKDKSND